MNSAHIGLPRRSSYLRQQQIYAERRVLVFEMALEILDRPLEELRTLADTANDTDTAYGGMLRVDRTRNTSFVLTGVCYDGREFGTSSDIHACEHDWVIDGKELGERRREDLG